MRRSTPSFVAVVLAAAIPLIPACGGAQSIDFGNTVDSGSGSGSGSGGGSGGAPQDSGSGGTDAGQGPVDAVAVVDVTEPVDVTPVEEPPPTGPAVLCPMNGVPATCQAGDFCCVVGVAMQGNQTDTCEPGGGSCSGGTTIQCAAAADCPSGQVCCGTQQTVNNMVSYTDVVCAASCTGTNQRIFCDQSAPDTCPPAEPTCALSTLLPGYNVCQQ